MRACWYTETGPAQRVLRCGEQPRPVAGVGEVLVEVVFSGVNTTDIKRRSGARGGLPYPRVIPGYDAAGVIVATGEGVPEARIDDRVWVWEAAHRTPDGASAEYVSVPASRAMPLPDAASFETGASLGVPAITACHGLLLGGNLHGETVIITGGAGMVGNCAIVLAKRMGATVIATARDQEKAEDARRAGADHVAPADAERLAGLALEVTDGVGVRHMLDVDLGAHLGHAWRAIAENGSLAAYGTQREANPPLPFARYMYRNISIHGIAIFNVPEAAKLRAVTMVQQAVVDGALQPRLDRRYALDELAAAHQRLESGAARGKILIEI